jgi:hypothetical protein
MSIRARIWWDATLDSYVVSTSYNSKLVDSLKQFIPSGSRDFDPPTKFWYIKEQYGDFVRQICESAFGVDSVLFTSKNVTQQSTTQNPYASYPRPGSAPYNQTAVASSSPLSTEDAIIAFMNLVPYEAAKKCYLVASASLHPDKPTGDAQKMSRLNQLWERIEKEFYKR